MSRTARLLILAATVLPLAGCPFGIRPTPPPTIPKVVRVTVTRYMPVPRAMTTPCPIADPGSTWGDAVDVAKQRKLALEQCNRQLDEIANLPLTPPNMPATTSTSGLP